MKFDFEFPGEQPPEDITLAEAIILVKFITADGSIGWMSSHTEGLNIWEKIGILRTTLLQNEHFGAFELEVVYDSNPEEDEEPGI